MTATLHNTILIILSSIAFILYVYILMEVEVRNAGSTAAEEWEATKDMTYDIGPKIILTHE